MYTNWGFTNGSFEPLDDPDRKCAEICVADDCTEEEMGWKVASCDNQNPFICQIECT